MVRSSAAILICGIVAFFSDFIFNEIIFGPKVQTLLPTNFCDLGKQFDMGDTMCITEINLPIQNREMGGQFSMHMWTSITVDLFCFPFHFMGNWKFISPALYEKRKIRGIVYHYFFDIIFIEFYLDTI